METLKPCPFCGSKKLAIGYSGQPAKSSFVHCLNCKATGGEIPAITVTGGLLDFDKTLAAWNTRAPTEREKRLEEVLRKIQYRAEHESSDIDGDLAYIENIAKSALEEVTPCQN